MCVSEGSVKRGGKNGYTEGCIHLDWMGFVKMPCEYGVKYSALTKGGEHFG